MTFDQIVPSLLTLLLTYWNCAFTRDLLIGWIRQAIHEINGVETYNMGPKGRTSLGSMLSLYYPTYIQYIYRKFLTFIPRKIKKFRTYDIYKLKIILNDIIRNLHKIHCIWSKKYKHRKTKVNILSSGKSTAILYSTMKIFLLPVYCTCNCFSLHLL